MLRILLFLMPIFAWLLSPVVTAETLVPAPPRINASSYLVMDYHSGRLVVNENADKRVEPASLTKIMTALVALDAAPLQEVVKIDRRGRASFVLQLPVRGRIPPARSLDRHAGGQRE